MDLNMSDLVPPVNAEDAFETSYMKGLTTVQEDGDTDGFVVDCYFLSLLQGYGYEYLMRKPAEGSRSELYPLLDFVIQVTI